MLFFVLAGFISILLAFLSQYENKRRLLLLSLFVIFYIIAFQDAIGCDFPSYQTLFNNIMSGSAERVWFRTSENRQGLEIGWYYLNQILGKQFNTFYAVTVLVAFFDCYTLYQLLKRIPNQWHWVAVGYFYFQPMLFFMSGLRQSVAICFFVLAIIRLNNKCYLKALILLILGFTFHNSIIYGLFFVPFYYLFVSHYFERNTYLFAIIFTAIFFLELVFVNSLQLYFSSVIVETVDTYSDTYTGYVEELAEGASLSYLNTLSRVFVFIISIFAFLKCEVKNRWILGLSIVAQIGALVFANIGTVGRVMLYVSVFTVPAYAMIPLCVKIKEYKLMFAVFVLFIALRSFLNSLTISQFAGFRHYHTIFNVF